MAAAGVALGCSASVASPVRGAARQLSLPSGAAVSGQDAALESVACPRERDCLAVGSYSERGGADQPMAIAAATVWRRGEELPLPFGADADPGAQQAVLESVSCRTVGACVAVGYYTDQHGNAEPMVLSESAGTWGVPSELTLPVNAAPTGQNSALYAVSCPGGVGHCVAVGYYTDVDGNSEAMVVGQSGGAWASAAELELPLGANETAGAEQAALYSVACTEPGDCFAVGSYSDLAGNGEPMAVRETVGVWRAAEELSLPANAIPSPVGQYADLYSIACTGPRSCIAVGSYTDSDDNHQPMVIQLRGGVWRRAQERSLPSNADTTANRQNAALYAVSCARGGACAAVGGYTDAGGGEEGLLLREARGRWRTAAELALPANAARGGGDQNASLYAVACPSTDACVAVGTYRDGRGGIEPMAAGV